jgi:hypothetical protein
MLSCVRDSQAHDPPPEYGDAFLAKHGRDGMPNTLVLGARVLHKRSDEQTSDEHANTHRHTGRTANEMGSACSCMRIFTTSNGEMTARVTKPVKAPATTVSQSCDMCVISRAICDRLAALFYGFKIHLTKSYEGK